MNDDVLIEVVEDEAQDIQSPDTEIEEPDSSSDSVEDSEVGTPDDSGSQDSDSFPDESLDMADGVDDTVDSDTVGDTSSDELGSDADLVEDDLLEGQEAPPADLSEVGEELAEIKELLQQSDVFAVPADYPSTAPLQGGYYIDCSAGLLFVPREAQYGAFAYDDSGELVNITDSTIYGIIQRGSSVYELRFSSFGTAEFRERDGSSWQWTSVSTGTVSASNVEIFDDGNAVRLWPTSTMLALISILLLGVIAWRQFMRR